MELLFVVHVILVSCDSGGGGGGGCLSDPTL